MSDADLAPALAGGASTPDSAPVIDTNPPPVGADAPVNDAPPSIDDTLEAAWNKSHSNGVDKGPDGKFVSPNGKAADPAPANPDSAVQPPSEVVEPAKPAIDPPISWTAEAKAYWAKLPPEAQAYIAQRESEAHTAITSNGQRLKSFEPIEQVIQPYRADIARRGLQPAQAISVLLEAQRGLDSDLDGGIINIGRTYGRNEIDLAAGILSRVGVDLRALLTGQQGSLPAPDPRLGQVTQELSTIKQHIQQQQRTLEQQQEAEAAATLKAFANDPKNPRPYFDEVRGLMGNLLRPTLDGNGNVIHPAAAETLEEAYDMAVNASPKVRARIQADQRAAEEKKQAELKAKAEDEAKKKAAEAAKSARVNVRGSSAHPNPKTIDETIDELARRAYG